MSNYIGINSKDDNRVCGMGDVYRTSHNGVYGMGESVSFGSYTSESQNKQKLPASSIDLGRRKWVFHIDIDLGIINNTCMIDHSYAKHEKYRDSTKIVNLSVESYLNRLLSEYSWGAISARTGLWELIRESYPSPSEPSYTGQDNLIKYSDYIRLYEEIMNDKYTQKERDYKPEFLGIESSHPKRQSLDGDRVSQSEDVKIDEISLLHQDLTSSVTDQFNNLTVSATNFKLELEMFTSDLHPGSHWRYYFEKLLGNLTVSFNNKGTIVSNEDKLALGSVLALDAYLNSPDEGYKGGNAQKDSKKNGSSRYSKCKAKGILNIGMGFWRFLLECVATLYGEFKMIFYTSGSIDDSFVLEFIEEYNDFINGKHPVFYHLENEYKRINTPINKKKLSEYTLNEDQKYEMSGTASLPHMTIISTGKVLQGYKSVYKDLIHNHLGENIAIIASKKLDKKDKSNKEHTSATKNNSISNNFEIAGSKSQPFVCYAYPSDPRVYHVMLQGGLLDSKLGICYKQSFRAFDIEAGDLCYDIEAYESNGVTLPNYFTTSPKMRSNHFICLTTIEPLSFLIDDKILYEQIFKLLLPHYNTKLSQKLLVTPAWLPHEEKYLDDTDQVDMDCTTEWWESSKRIRELSFKKGVNNIRKKSTTSQKSSQKESGHNQPFKKYQNDQHTVNSSVYDESLKSHAHTLNNNIDALEETLDSNSFTYLNEEIYPVLLSALKKVVVDRPSTPLLEIAFFVLQYSKQQNFLEEEHIINL